MWSCSTERSYSVFIVRSPLLCRMRDYISRFCLSTGHITAIHNSLCRVHSTNGTDMSLPLIGSISWRQQLVHVVARLTLCDRNNPNSYRRRRPFQILLETQFSDIIFTLVIESVSLCHISQNPINCIYGTFFKLFKSTDLVNMITGMFSEYITRYYVCALYDGYSYRWVSVICCDVNLYSTIHYWLRAKCTLDVLVLLGIFLDLMRSNCLQKGMKNCLEKLEYCCMLFYIY